MIGCVHSLLCYHSIAITHDMIHSFYASYMSSCVGSYNSLNVSIYDVINKRIDDRRHVSEII